MAGINEETNGRESKDNEDNQNPPTGNATVINQNQPTIPADLNNPHPILRRYLDFSKNTEMTLPKGTGIMESLVDEAKMLCDTSLMSTKSWGTKKNSP